MYILLIHFRGYTWIFKSGVVFVSLIFNSHCYRAPKEKNYLFILKNFEMLKRYLNDERFSHWFIGYFESKVIFKNMNEKWMIEDEFFILKVKEKINFRHFKYPVHKSAKSNKDTTN